MNCLLFVCSAACLWYVWLSWNPQVEMGVAWTFFLAFEILKETWLLTYLVFKSLKLSYRAFDNLCGPFCPRNAFQIHKHAPLCCIPLPFHALPFVWGDLCYIFLSFISTVQTLPNSSLLFTTQFKCHFHCDRSIPAWFGWLFSPPSCLLSEHLVHSSTEGSGHQLLAYKYYLLILRCTGIMAHTFLNPKYLD